MGERPRAGLEGRTSLGRTCWVPGRALSLAQFSAQAPLCEEETRTRYTAFCLSCFRSFPSTSVFHTQKIPHRYSLTRSQREKEWDHRAGLRWLPSGLTAAGPVT